MSSLSRAPRFHALWTHRAGRSILVMSREDWDTLQVTDRPVLISADTIAGMPIGEVANDAEVLAALAAREASGRVRLSVFRLDPQDDPTPVNRDDYLVYEAFPPDLDVWGMIQSATTDPGPNFLAYRDDNVFLIRERPDDGHWLAQLPPEVQVLLDTDKAV